MIGYHAIGSLLGKRLADTSSQASGCARHQSDLIFKPHDFSAEQ